MWPWSRRAASARSSPAWAPRRSARPARGTRSGCGSATPFYVSGYGLVPPESGPVLGAWAAGLPPGVLLFLDPGPLVADIPAAILDPVLSRCDWYSCNQREAAILAGESDPVEAARLLARRTGRAGVIVRAGPEGCVLALRVAGPARPGRPEPRPHPRARRRGGGYHGRGRRPLRRVHGRARRRASPGRRRLARERRGRADRHPLRARGVPVAGRTRRLPGLTRTPYSLTVSTIVMGTAPGSATSRAVSEIGLLIVTVTTTQEPPALR